MLFALNGLYFRLILVACSGREELLIINDIRVAVVTSMAVVCLSSRISRRIVSLNLSSNLGRKSAAVCWLILLVCFFEIILQHIVTCIPQRWWHCFRLEETCDWFTISQDIRWLCFFPQRVCRFEKCQKDCQFFSEWRTFCSADGGVFPYDVILFGVFASSYLQNGLNFSAIVAIFFCNSSQLPGSAVLLFRYGESKYGKKVLSFESW